MRPFFGGGLVTFSQKTQYVIIQICRKGFHKIKGMIMKKILSTLTAVFMVFGVSGNLSLTAFAQEDSGNRFYLGEMEKVKKDSGFAEAEELSPEDPHYGWNLGRFVLEGQTQMQSDKDGMPVALKNAGDTVQLKFELLQDIDALNGNKDLVISEDENGYDKNYGVKKTNFGRGTLIVQHVDYQNKKSDPIIYVDYLKTPDHLEAIELNEEGKYSITLDYELENNKHVYFGQSILPGYTNYRISADLFVTNGNCMVFPKDAKTDSELSNESVAENGFYLDLARSRNLKIYMKKEVYSKKDDRLVEDVRFNKPVRDGDVFTDEGIYTISVSNPYTGQETEKVIYVGTDSVLKASAVTGKPIAEIRELLAEGKTILDDGTISEADSTLTSNKAETANVEAEDSQPQNAGFVTVGNVGIILAAGALIWKKKNHGMKHGNGEAAE